MQAGGSRLAERRWLRGRMVAPSMLACLRDWFPVAIDDAQVAWRHLPGRFSAPFFRDELVRQAPGERAVCFTPLDWLDRLEPHVPPSAVLFHASRCGSTLLAQLLATLPQCIVYSEPPVIDDFLARHGEAPAPGAAARLRQLLFALGQRRCERETHFVVKLDCWHIRHLPLLRAALPDTPFWFLYREPEAIMASHRRMRGPQMVPGMVLPPQFGDGLAPGDLDGFCARVIAHMFERALVHAHELHLLDYRQLPAVVWEDLLARLGIDCGTEELQAMRERSRFHAKSALEGYQGDPRAAPVGAGVLADVMPLYERLEAIRLRRAAG